MASSMLRSFLPALLSFATGCSLHTINAISPRADRDLREGISYGDVPRQKLDVYTPRGAASTPLVVFFYGGSWRTGDRGLYRFVAESLTARGFVVVIPDYRLYPEVTFPGFVQDAALAVRFTAEHAAEWGGDPKRLFVMGHSAGAHITALLALDPHYLKDAGAPPHTIHGAIGLAGPYDFLPFGKDVRQVMGPEAQWPATQPINFAGKDAPPMLLLHGRTDATVRARNTRNLAQALTAAGAAVRPVLYPKVSHVDIVLALAPRLAFLAPVLDDIQRFIEDYGRSS